MTTPTFTPFDDPGAARRAVYRYRVSDEGLALSDEHKAALDTFIQYDAIALTISQTAEYVFAKRDELAAAAPGLVAVAAQCAQYAARQCIDQMAGARGMGIAEALRRDSGEQADPRLPWPDPATDPEPREDILPAIEEEAIEEAAPESAAIS